MPLLALVIDVEIVVRIGSTDDRSANRHSESLGHPFTILNRSPEKNINGPAGGMNAIQNVSYCTST